ARAPAPLRLPHLARTAQVRAQRQEAIERLAEKPLRAAELQIPGADVVAVAVAPHAVERLGLAHVARGAANDDAQLSLVIVPLGHGRQRDLFAAGRERVAELRAQDRPARPLPPGPPALPPP